MKKKKLRKGYENIYNSWDYLWKKGIDTNDLGIQLQADKALKRLQNYVKSYGMYEK